MGRTPNKHNYKYPVIRRLTLDISKPFGPQLAHLRRNNGISHQEIADRAGWKNRGNLANWEKASDRQRGSLVMAAAYARAFNVRELCFDLSNYNPDEQKEHKETV